MDVCAGTCGSRAPWGRRWRPEVATEVFSRWFVEIIGEVKVQPPAHTAVGKVRMLLLVTKAWHCPGGTRAACAWRGGWDGCPAPGHW